MFYVLLMLFVIVDILDLYFIFWIKMVLEGCRWIKIKDNEVNLVWNEEFMFFLDGVVDNKLCMFINLW